MMRRLLVLLVAAGTLACGQYVLKSAVLDCGGSRAASSGYSAGFSAGQSAASGWMSGSGYRALLGFWFRAFPTGVSEQPSVTEPLRLTMDVRPVIVRRAVTIRYSLPAESDVALSLLDCTGREVGELVRARQPSGHYTAHWDVGSASRDRLPNGSYFVRLQAGDRVLVAKAAVVR